MYIKIKKWLKSKNKAILAALTILILLTTSVIPCFASWYTDVPENVGRCVSGRWLFSGGTLSAYANSMHRFESSYAISNDSDSDTNYAVDLLYGTEYPSYSETVWGGAQVTISNYQQSINIYKSVPVHMPRDVGLNRERIEYYNDPFYYLFDYSDTAENSDSLIVSFLYDSSLTLEGFEVPSNVVLSCKVTDLLSVENGRFLSYDIAYSVDVFDYYDETNNNYSGKLNFNDIVMESINSYTDLSLCRIDDLRVVYVFDNITSIETTGFSYELGIYYDLAFDLQFVYNDVHYTLTDNKSIDDFVVDIVTESITYPSDYLRSYVDWIATAVSGFFSFELFPNFYLGGIIVTIIAFCLVMWWLKMFGGG